MDALLLVARLGTHIHNMRTDRALTMIALAGRSGVTRRKLSEIEKGELAVTMRHYAKVIACMGAESEVIKVRHPTFEALPEIIK